MLVTAGYSCSCDALLTAAFITTQANAIVLGATTATAVAAAMAAGRSITRHGSVANISKTRNEQCTSKKRNV